MPKSNIEFWQNKFDKNIARDKQVTKDLKAIGWKQIVIWECELLNRPKLEKRLKTIFELE